MEKQLQVWALKAEAKLEYGPWYEIKEGQILRWSKEAQVVFRTYMRFIPEAKCIHQNITYSLEQMQIYG